MSTSLHLGNSHDAGAQVPNELPAVPVLIVDDNAAKRVALRSVLQPLGYEIVEADSGIAALRCVMARDFAVIVLDVRMPDMDGFETAALIRERRQSEMTPIIFVTGYARDEMTESDLYSQGAVDFIFAPVPPEELRAKVRVFANLFMRAQTLAARALEVQQSADQLTLLTDAAPIGIFQTDAQKRYVYTNPGWSEITGFAAEDAAGRDWDAIMAPEERARLRAERLSDAPDSADLSHRFEIEIPGAAKRIALVTAKPIPARDGGTAGWVGFLANVTVEAEAQAAMSDARDAADEASRLKSDFLANMSHEIRTPMNGVIGMTELLLDTDLDERQRDYAGTIRDSGGALLTIIDDILDFSKVEAGKVELESADFDMCAVVRDVVDLLGGSAKARGLSLVAETGGDRSLLVSGDAGRLRQILMNLVGNAIKFTAAGEVAVRIGRTAPSGAASIVRFEVSDTGDGIAPGKTALIFDPFVQADTSTSRKYGGTGLGLAIVAHLVELMGGECGVSSVLGEGSTFWFTVRVGPALGEQPVDLAGPCVAPTASGAGAGRLLLAEDNVINQKVALAMLSNAGYHVDTVHDGAAAVTAVAEHAYDAVLMDCQMPELSGYEATAAIRAQQGDGRRVPIIAMTAGARAEDRDRCLEAGMDGYLSKPVDRSALLSLVARYVAPVAG